MTKDYDPSENPFLAALNADVAALEAEAKSHAELFPVWQHSILPGLVQDALNAIEKNGWEGGFTAPVHNHDLPATAEEIKGMNVFRRHKMKRLIDRLHRDHDAPGMFFPLSYVHVEWSPHEGSHYPETLTEHTVDVAFLDPTGELYERVVVPTHPDDENYYLMTFDENKYSRWERIVRRRVNFRPMPDDVMQQEYTHIDTTLRAIIDPSSQEQK